MEKQKKKTLFQLTALPNKSTFLSTLGARLFQGDATPPLGGQKTVANFLPQIQIHLCIFPFCGLNRHSGKKITVFFRFRSVLGLAKGGRESDPFFLFTFLTSEKGGSTVVFAGVIFIPFKPSQDGRQNNLGFGGNGPGAFCQEALVIHGATDRIRRALFQKVAGLFNFRDFSCWTGPTTSYPFPNQLTYQKKDFPIRFLSRLLFSFLLPVFAVVTLHLLFFTSWQVGGQPPHLIGFTHKSRSVKNF